MKRALLALALGCALSANLAGPAAAFRDFDHRDRPGRHFAPSGSDWPWWRSGHWYHGEHFRRTGWWWIAGGVWYYYPAPVYPYPPVIVVAPAPPVAAAPPPPAPSPQAQPYCREYQGDAIINGTNQPFYGTACLQPDGAWHIVR